MKLIIICLTLLIVPSSFAQFEGEINLSCKEKKELIETVELLMQEAKIPIRDTWKGWNGYNFDDFYTNNNSFGGKKHLDIAIKEDGWTEVVGGRPYEIKGFKSLAYDHFKIRVPKRFAKIKHPIVHEIVHFLQENTIDQDKQYIYYNNNSLKNYFEYVSQKAELEAHYIQLIFIEKYELGELRIKDDILNQFKEKIKARPTKRAFILDLIMFSKSNGII